MLRLFRRRRQEEWSQVTAANSEYRHVQATGAFLNDSETLVQALTDLGAGFWVLTPLRLGDGTVVLVNRGFVPPEQRERAAHGAAEATTAATVTGLLRITEPKGWFLRRNDPAKNHWYSRDVQAIAAARGLRPGGAVLYRSGGQCCRRCGAVDASVLVATVASPAEPTPRQSVASP